MRQKTPYTTTNNKSIALNILQVDNEQKISHLFKSKHNKTRENMAVLLILENKYHTAVKKLNSLLKNKTECSKHFCINCLKPF